MKPTDILSNEHRVIEQVLDCLDRMVTNSAEQHQLDEEPARQAVDFFRNFADRCHHGKEEEFLFPALEVAGVPREGGPIGVMLSEHEQGRKLVARLKDAVTDNKSGDKANASGVQLIINEYVALLTQHIVKENTVLFPMADAKLD